MTGLNCRPAACKAAALPAELIALRIYSRKNKLKILSSEIIKNLVIFFLKFADEAMFLIT